MSDLDECLLAKKFQYQQILIHQYSEVVFVTPEDLLELHSFHNPNDFKATKAAIFGFMTEQRHIPIVSYVLGAGICTDENHCCNGIRYGDEGAYLSLPQLPSSIWVPF